MSNQEASPGSEGPLGLIVVAAGSSRRMGSTLAKVFLEIGGTPVLGHVARTVSDWDALAAVALVVRAEDRERAQGIWQRHYRGSARLHLVQGGAERSDSVLAGLAALPLDDQDVVLVHDAARPLASRELFSRVAVAARTRGAAIPGVPVADTLRRSRPEGSLQTVSREDLHRIQTPQGFQKGLLQRAHDMNHDKKDDKGQAIPASDDAVLVEQLGEPVHLVEGEAANLKITQPEDLDLVRRLLEARASNRAASPGVPRIGFGEDLHRLAAPGPLRLGGCDLPGDVHALGHSDGDALLHALTDAILGALALGDIGQHFSDRDPAHADRDSAEMLRHALDLARQKGFRLLQVDTVVHLERPRLAPHRELIRARVAAILELDVAQVSLKAKTGEGLGDIGSGQAISCRALAVLAGPEAGHEPL